MYSKRNEYRIISGRNGIDLESETIIKLDLEDEAKRPVPKYLELEAPPFRLTEMLRYSGVPLDVAKRMVDGLRIEESEAGDFRLTGNEELLREGSEYNLLLKNLEKAVALTKGKLIFKAGFISGKLNWDEEGFPVLPVAHRSENLKKNLHDCEGYVMFAATIGAEMDRLIRRYEISDSSMGVFLQGVGAERAESLCNYFNDMVKEEAARMGYTAHPRFSPGFGDFPVTVQREFLDTLDAGRRMGITLSESCLMAPTKSVTAIIGLEPVKKETE